MPNKLTFPVVNPTNWKNFVCNSSPKSPKSSHPYICFNQLTGNYYLSDRKANKLSLGQISQVTQQHIALFQEEKAELGSGLNQMQQRSLEKLKSRLFIVRAIVKIGQCLRNAFAGLGFQSNASLLEDVCRRLSGARLRNSQKPLTSKDANKISKLLEKDYSKETNQKNQEEFKRIIQDVSQETIFEQAKKNIFSIKDDIVYSEDFKLQVMFNTMNWEQFKALIQGSMELEKPPKKFCNRILVFSHAQPSEAKAKLYTCLAELYDKKSQASENYWGDLETYYPEHVEFMRYVMVASCKIRTIKNV